MEEMTRKQPDVDKITKTHKRKAAVETQNQSQIPVFGKGRAGRTYHTDAPSGSATWAICAAVDSPSHYLAAAAVMSPALPHFKRLFVHRKAIAHANHVRVGNSGSH